MEKRIGSVSIIINETGSVAELNSILSAYGGIILGRMGLPVRERGLHVINLIIDCTTDEAGALTGKIGRLKGVQVKVVLAK